ncbi:MAG: hypothetical protein ABI893_01200 [Polaromonas sp.]|uniref:hypothetical protein n=1 Tax=Polaromonas sp. TaxID=1869339 RepID=UPI003263DD00
MKPFSSSASIILMLFMALAPGLRAQPAINSGASTETLPMRNLQIEVRQVRGSSSSREALGAQGGVVLQPGNSGANVNITAQNSQRSDSRDLMQRVLVLNGRNVNINLGNSRPLRLVQTFVQNGVVRYIGGTVLIEANSGFSARPVWRGGDSAELELAAAQSMRSGSALPSTSSASTALALPLNEWVTVAQSDDALSGSNNGLTGSSQSASREGVRVEVRMTVR